jgi:hypothetical protein
MIASRVPDVGVHHVLLVAVQGCRSKPFIEHAIDALGREVIGSLAGRCTDALRTCQRARRALGLGVLTWRG